MLAYFFGLSGFFAFAGSFSGAAVDPVAGLLVVGVILAGVSLSLVFASIQTKPSSSCAAEALKDTAAAPHSSNRKMPAIRSGGASLVPGQGPLRNYNRSRFSRWKP